MNHEGGGMDTNNIADMTEFSGYLASPHWESRVSDFLNERGLHYEGPAEFMICLLSHGRIIGTGAADGNVIKYLAVHPSYRQYGIASHIVSELVTYAYTNGQEHLFLFTNPKNRAVFVDIGFYPILQTDDVLFMENRKQGLQGYVDFLRSETERFIKERAIGEGAVGSIVANCNPFTNGHRYLIERASKECSLVHLFVVSSEKSLFSAKDRYEMVKEGVSSLRNVMVHKTEDYLVSPATFPSYFLDDIDRAEQINCNLDIALFMRFFVPELGISKRYLGTEPYSHVTNAYNAALQRTLKKAGVEVIEIERKNCNGKPISASLVREYIHAGNMQAILPLVPASTYEFIVHHSILNQ